MFGAIFVKATFLMTESVATVLLSQFVKGAKLSHDSELQEMEGEDAQTYMTTYIYIPTHKTIHMHIHIYMQMHKNIRTGIQIDRYLDIEIRDTYTVLLSCNTITCTEHMRVQIHLHVPLEVPQLYLHIESN